MLEHIKRARCLVSIMLGRCLYFRPVSLDTISFFLTLLDNMASPQVFVNSLSQTPGQRTGPPLPSYESLHEDSRIYGQHDIISTRSLSEDHRKSYANPLAQAVDEQCFVKGWPDEPRRLRNRTILTLFFNLCEALVTLAPIAFIGTLVARL